MAAILEVKYFNSFILKNQVPNVVSSVRDFPSDIWNGSHGIPKQIGGFPIEQNLNYNRSWYLEESRIRAGFNNTSTDYGVRAYLVEEEPNSSIRFNSLIYSGL